MKNRLTAFPLAFLLLTGCAAQPVSSLSSVAPPPASQEASSEASRQKHPDEDKLLAALDYNPNLLIPEPTQSLLLEHGVSVLCDRISVDGEGSLSFVLTLRTENGQTLSRTIPAFYGAEQGWINVRVGWGGLSLFDEDTLALIVGREVACYSVDSLSPTGFTPDLSDLADEEYLLLGAGRIDPQTAVIPVYGEGEYSLCFFDQDGAMTARQPIDASEVYSFLRAYGDESSEQYHAVCCTGIRLLPSEPPILVIEQAYDDWHLSSDEWVVRPVQALLEYEQGDSRFTILQYDLSWVSRPDVSPGRSMQALWYENEELKGSFYFDGSRHNRFWNEREISYSLADGPVLTAEIPELRLTMRFDFSAETADFSYAYTVGDLDNADSGSFSPSGRYSVNSVGFEAGGDLSAENRVLWDHQTDEVKFLTYAVLAKDVLFADDSLLCLDDYYAVDLYDTATAEPVGSLELNADAAPGERPRMSLGLCYDPAGRCFLVAWRPGGFDYGDRLTLPVYLGVFDREGNWLRTIDPQVETMISYKNFAVGVRLSPDGAGSVTLRVHSDLDKETVKTVRYLE